MKKLINPFNKTKTNNCFACSTQNTHGLKMEFYEYGDEVISIWQPDKSFEGWHNVLHGGIQATLMDEIASWLVFVKVKTSGVTSRIDMRLKKTVFMDKGRLTLRASLIEMKRNIAVISTKLFDNTDTLCSEATVEYFTFPEKLAIGKYGYPGYESFYIK